MPFSFQPTTLPGVIVVKARVFADERGFFLESYRRDDFVAAGITDSFVQDNHSFSTRGVLRGIHFQYAPHAQGKLVRTIDGTAAYVAQADGGIRWDDPDLAIEWPIEDPVVSGKDAGLPSLSELLQAGRL